MIFVGSFLGGDELSVPLTATNIDNITHQELTHGEYDGLYVTKNTEIEMGTSMPTAWDFDTIMFADFNGNTLAGNLSVALDKISHIVIKRKREDEFEWTTIEVKEVHDIDDMNLVGKDMTAELGAVYQYAAVPSLNGVESIYSIAEDKCESNRLIIADCDEVWVTYITDGYCDYTRTYPINMLQTMYSKYPTSVRNSYQNYDVIDVSGTWVPTTEDDECELAFGTEYNKMRTKYQKEFVDFLTNDKPKILKNLDGRTWLCMLSGDVSDTAEDIYSDRKISFQMTEIGSVDSNQDLFEAGFNQSVTEEWW